jgi:hypothetical protein
MKNPRNDSRTTSNSISDEMMTANVSLISSVTRCSVLKTAKMWTKKATSEWGPYTTFSNKFFQKREFIFRYF